MLLNGALSWILTNVQSVDPILRTLLAGIGMLLETSVLVGLVVPGDTIVILGNRSLDQAEKRMKAVRITVAGKVFDIYPERIQTN